jgi:hypothetical protein
MEITNPENYVTDEASWWFVFNPETLLLLFPPQQCRGNTSSTQTLVVFDTLQECENYISTNNLKYKEETQLPKLVRKKPNFRPPEPTPEPPNQE